MTVPCWGIRKLSEHSRIRRDKTDDITNSAKLLSKVIISILITHFSQECINADIWFIPAVFDDFRTGTPETLSEPVRRVTVIIVGTGMIIPQKDGSDIYVAAAELVNENETAPATI